jgi:hypothetical protein
MNDDTIWLVGVDVDAYEVTAGPHVAGVTWGHPCAVIVRNMPQGRVELRITLSPAERRQLGLFGRTVYDRYQREQANPSAPAAPLPFPASASTGGTT